MTCTANTPSEDVYSPIHEITNVVSNCSTLPHTGLDIWLLVVGGLVLLILGYLLRRVVKDDDGPVQA